MPEWIIAQLAAGVVAAAAAVIVCTKRNKQKAALCDTCKYLAQKNSRKTANEYKYRCSRRSSYYSTGFDVPPEYCSEYEPRIFDHAGQ